MLWVLGYIDKLDYPSGVCDVPKAFKILDEAGSYNDFFNKSKMKNVNEILDETDLIYRYNWACVNTRLKGQEAPSNLDSGVVKERHYAFNWLQDWDDISTDT